MAATGRGAGMGVLFRSAEAIVAGAKARGVSTGELEAFSAITGKGVTGEVSGQPVALGNQPLMKDLGVEVAAWAQRADELRAIGRTVRYLAPGESLAGLIGVADPVKDSTPAALESLRRSGLRIVVVTGDKHATARLEIYSADGFQVPQYSPGVQPVRGRPGPPPPGLAACAASRRPVA